MKKFARYLTMRACSASTVNVYCYHVRRYIKTVGSLSDITESHLETYIETLPEHYHNTFRTVWRSFATFAAEDQHVSLPSLPYTKTGRAASAAHPRERNIVELIALGVPNDVLCVSTWQGVTIHKGMFGVRRPGKTYTYYATDTHEHFSALRTWWDSAGVDVDHLDVPLVPAEAGVKRCVARNYVMALRRRLAREAPVDKNAPAGRPPYNATPPVAQAASPEFQGPAGAAAAPASKFDPGSQFRLFQSLAALPDDPACPLTLPDSA